MAISQRDILGKGWAYPFRFTSTGRVRKITGIGGAEGIEKIKMAMRQILGTRIGSRVIDRDFGSDVRGIVFEPIDDLTATNLRGTVVGALRRWERRISVTRVDISLERHKEGVLEAMISFRVISTQQDGNLVYPFYLTPEMRVQGQITV